MNNNTQTPIYDVLVIGAGLSGICAGFHLQDKCPNKSFLILEARENMGGTWDLFKYPGIRSDSDMYTLGFPFYPWKNPKAIADGSAILQYIKDTAKEFNLNEKIRFQHKVIAANWSDIEKMWTLELEANEAVENTVLKAKFVFSCSGYYNYEKGHTPNFKGSENFKGKIIHPQKWDTNLDYTNKKVVVIGSGATAVTLVPEMAKKAEKVTMLQRSPSYIMNLPSEDIIANTLKKVLPAQMAHNVVRKKNVYLSLALYNACRKYPDFMRKMLKKPIKKQLGDKYKEENFNPKYNPWDQRLCLIPDNDLFEALKTEKAEIVTDTVDKFTENGILLNSGKILEADIIVTATGLKVQLLGGVKPTINNELVETGNMKAYKGVLFSDVPNFAISLGYTNASWTLKADLNCEFVARIINYMDEKNYSVVKPKFDDEMEIEPLLDFDAGYIKRALDILPKQGTKQPWKVYQSYLKDVKLLKHASVDDEYLVYE